MNAADISTTGSTRLAAHGLSKSYGATRALKNVDFRLGRGEVVALVGENGAGKSTLARILAGAVMPDEGRMFADGSPVRFRSPREALKRGIAFIPQELSYPPDFTTAENLVLGNWPSRHGLVTRARIRAAAAGIAAEHGLFLELERKMGTCRAADLQTAEILKALGRDASILILDEPTSALDREDSERLLRDLRLLANRGVSIVFISHRFDEVASFSDRICGFRDGELVEDIATADYQRSDLISRFATHSRRHRTDTSEAGSQKQPVLRLARWRSGGRTPLRDVSLEVQRGEVLGLYGQRGSGAEVLAEGLAGLTRPVSGWVMVDGKPRPPFRSSREASAAGIAYVPADRGRQGIVPTLSLHENLTLMKPSGHIVLRRSAERAFVDQQIKSWRIRCRNPDQRVSELSGGNQQKVLVASRLIAAPRILVLSEPTRGVDLPSRQQIHSNLRQLATAGTAVVVATTDVGEAANLPDRVVVLRDGQVMGELLGSHVTHAAILELSGGRR